MSFLVFAEASSNGIAEPALRALSAARRLGEVDVLVAGHDCTATAEAAARLDGVGTVLVAEHPRLAGLGAEILTATVLPLMERYDGILAAATTTAKNFMPRVAALLDVMQISEALDILGPDTFVRPVYAGNFLQTVRTRDGKLVMTVRASAFAVSTAGGEVAPIEPVAAVVPDGPVGRLVGESSADAGRPDLAAARIVVSGGRALGSKEQFEQLIGPLAERLNAAVGASRAAVDAGFVTNDLQVGQTGKIVAPDLYIAVGISGAIQHLAGMKDSSLIVAINQDADCPMVRLADYSLVGDLFELVPELTAALAKP